MVNSNSVFYHYSLEISIIQGRRFASGKLHRFAEASTQYWNRYGSTQAAPRAHRRRTGLEMARVQQQKASGAREDP